MISLPIINISSELAIIQKPKSASPISPGIVINMIAFFLQTNSCKTKTSRQCTYKDTTVSIPKTIFNKYDF